MNGCRQLDQAGPHPPHLVPAQVHSGSAAPLLQAGVSQFQGGHLGPQICIQLMNVSLHFGRFLFCLRAKGATSAKTSVRHLSCMFWPGPNAHLHLSYLPELPLQLDARLLLLVVALPESELRGPVLRLQLIPQLRQQKTQSITSQSQ